MGAYGDLYADNSYSDLYGKYVGETYDDLYEENSYGNLYDDSYQSIGQDAYDEQAYYQNVEERYDDYGYSDNSYESDAVHFDAADYYQAVDDEEEYASFDEYANVQYGVYDQQEQDHEEEGDNHFSMYFNGNNRVEEQNAEMEPNVFWTVNVFGILCGVVLCFMMICYIRSRRTKHYSFSKLQTKGTDFEESASEFSVIGGGGNKFDFHAVNLPLNQRMSDEETTTDEEEELIQQPVQAPGGDPSGENSHSLDDDEEDQSDEYQNGSDEDILRSHKQHEMLGIDDQ